ncbi:multisite-specific tRNA:(cytosine-C(5))-methyltransferase [Malassezia equina]|uniref:Multisite-specific tRNA:(Cytosine-C(5))-methyltransferase n=1 Tax=Malassezia equina TaxID=1381935 RepID=A0AAF0EBP9_9BASI|nr:multisite-specific tRNA:(cytosine-C(5))-methyltransferase [Malassezia equina]
MGRGRAYRRGHGRGKAPGRSSGGERRADYATFEQTSPKFESYYQGQGILPADEWAPFLAAMRAPLPTTFRITSGKPTARQLLDAMKNIYVPFLSNVEFEGEKVTPPTQLPWYPEGLGWHLDVRKNVLRKSPEFKRFQQFLVHETEVGSISRQEAVSMLPPLFLDVQPEHLVLDMCAAPGSKTAQLIEAIHSPLTSEPDAFDPMPQGVVVANDSDTKRAHMLVHQAQRLPSPNLCVTNVDASNMANIQVAWKGEAPTDKIRMRDLKYDRILADVPCSGDGTLRKNLAIWKDWTPMNGVGLHALQLRILIRGLTLLRPGGRLVYSTCSLNPIENEAVVAAALRHFQGDVEIVDCADMVPALQRRPGMTHWKVVPGKGQHLAQATKTPESEQSHSHETKAEGQTEEKTLPPMPWVESYEALQSVDADLASRTPTSLWPQGDEEALHMERCIRVYPHLQNTGGFFVTVLTKKSTTPDESVSMAPGMIRAMDAMSAGDIPVSKRPADEEGPTEAKRVKSEAKAEAEPEAEPAKEDALPPVDKHRADREAKRRGQPEGVAIGAGGMPYREDPFAYVDPANADVQSCVEWFGLHHFPTANLLVRNPERVPLRSVYLTSNTVRAIVSGGGPGMGVHPTMNPLKVRLLNCGVKVFGRQESVSKATQAPNAMDVSGDAAVRRENVSAALACRWRVVSDSLHSMRPYLSEKVVIKATLADLAFFIKEYYPVLDKIPGEVGERIRQADMGSYVLDIEPSEHNGHQLTVRLCYPVWRSVASANLMLDKQEKSALSFRLFDTDLSDPEGQRQFSMHPQARKKQAELQAQKAQEESNEGRSEATA